MNRHRTLTILLLATVLLLAGCGAGGQQPGRQPSADWSRGLPVGEGATGTADLLVESDGESLYVVWPQVEGENGRIQFQRLGPTGLTVAQQSHPMPTNQLRAPRLAQSGDSLYLFWGQRIQGEPDWSLWYVPLASNGEMAGEPAQLSTPQTDAGDYAVAIAGDRSVVVVWEDDNGDAIFGRMLAGGAPVELATGSSPALEAGPDGRLYLAWWNEGIYFAPLPESLAAVEPALVAGVTRSFGDTQIKPVLSLAGDEAFVFWAIFSQSGLEAGTGRTEYVHFPLSNPVRQTPQQIWLRPEERPETQPYSSAYTLTELVPYPSTAAGTTRYIGEPAVAGSRGDELALVVSFDQDLRQQMQKQMALVLFAGGEPQGYLPAVKTTGFSSAGNLGSDADGNLYLLWQEGAGGLNVYYATTQPEARREMNALTAGDVTNLFLSAFFEGVVGLVFFPLALIWLAPGLLMLGVYHMRHETESLDRPLSRLLLVVGLVIYQVVKVLFMPAILSYVPFSAWLDIGELAGRVLQIITPVLTLGAGIVAAEIARRRRESVSTALYYLAIAGVDALLTLLIYGVNFSGIF